MREHKWGTVQKREERINVIANPILVGQHHLLDESQNNNLGDMLLSGEMRTHLMLTHFVFISSFLFSPAYNKHVSWLLGRDGDVSVSVIGEVDEFRSSKLLQNLMNNRYTHKKNAKNPLQRFHLVLLIDWFWLFFLHQANYDEEV